MVRIIFFVLAFGLIIFVPDIKLLTTNSKPGLVDIIFIALGIFYTLIFYAWIGDVAYLTTPSNLKRSASVLQIWLKIARIGLMILAPLVLISGILTILYNNSLPENIGLVQGVASIFSALAALVVVALLGAFLFWITSLSILAQSQTPEAHLTTVRKATAKMSSWLNFVLVGSALMLIWIFKPRLPGLSIFNHTPLGWFTLTCNVIGFFLFLWQTWETRKFALAAEAEANQGRLAATPQSAQTI